jgi:hypothetical protein
LSDQEEGKKRPKRRNRRHRSNGKKTPSGVKPKGDKEAVERALSRFTIDPPPMGFTQDMDPPAKTVNINWKLNAVAKSVQNKASPLVCSPGEFGFLPEERVEQIAKKLRN